MATKRKKIYHDWPGGKPHTIPYAQYLRQRAQQIAASKAPPFKVSIAPGYGFVPGGTGFAGLGKLPTGTPAHVAQAPPKPPDPRDATFNSSVARLLFNNKNQQDQINQTGSQDTADFNTMLQRMAQQRSRDLLAQDYSANKQNLFYSGQLGKRRGLVEEQYRNQQSDAQRDYDRRVQARQQALAQLGTITAAPGSTLGYTGTGQAGLDLSDLYNDAVARRQALDAALNAI